MTALGAGAVVFFASAAVLVLEILAGRMVAPYVGVSLETYTGIIGTVLAGIALGSAAGGRLADRVDPRRLVGPALVLGGALALLSQPVVHGIGPGVAGGGPVAVVILAVAAFFAPAVVLSAVSPMAAKLRLASVAETGAVVGGLSAAGTAGALVGTFATGFVLVAALPTSPIVLGLGAALVGVGMVLTWRLGARRPGPAVLAGVAVAAALAAGVPGPCEYETAYFCARVETDEARPTGRVLLLDSLRHSYVDLADPTYLAFRYVRLFADAVASAFPGDRPLSVLHLGGGGFTFPRYLLATRPGTTNVVLELDPELVRIDEERLGLRRGPNLRVRVGDARTAIADEPTDAYDVVIGDAFGGLSVPWHLATEEMVAEVSRVLRPGGVYVANVIDGGPLDFARAYAATLQEVFSDLAVVAPPGTTGAPAGPANHLLVGSDRPVALGSVDPTDGRVLAGAAADDFVGAARPLTDDYAPVDQLITRR